MLNDITSTIEDRWKLYFHSFVCLGATIFKKLLTNFNETTAVRENNWSDFEVVLYLCFFLWLSIFKILQMDFSTSLGKCVPWGKGNWLRWVISKSWSGSTFFFFFFCQQNTLKVNNGFQCNYRKSFAMWKGTMLYFVTDIITVHMMFSSGGGIHILSTSSCSELCWITCN